jgi:hypothetical protein
MKALEAKIPAPAKPRLSKAAERMVRLYEAWNQPAQAAAGMPSAADSWDYS